MRFKRREFKEACDVLKGAFIFEYHSADDEGYHVRCTNVHFDTKVDHPTKMVVGDVYFSAHWDGKALEIEGRDGDPDDVDLNDAKRACRAHFASLTTQDKIDYRIRTRDAKIEDTQEFMDHLKESIKSDGEFNLKFRKSDKRTLGFLEADLATLLQARKEDPFDNEIS